MLVFEKLYPPILGDLICFATQFLIKEKYLDYNINI